MNYLKIDDFKKYSYLSELKFSPNGDNIALIVKKINDENGYFSSIFIKGDRGYYSLTNEKGNVLSFIWLDNENILFHEIRDMNIKSQVEKGEKVSSFYKMNINGGEAKFAFNIDAEVSNIALLPNGDFLVHAVYYNHPVENNYDVDVIDDIPFWHNGKGFLKKRRNALYIYNLKAGLTQLTPTLGNVSNYRVSEKGLIAFSGTLYVPHIRNAKEDLYIIDSGEIKNLLDEPMFIKNFEFWNEQIVLAASTGEEYFYRQNPTFYILNVKNKMLRALAHYDRSIGMPINTDCIIGSGCTYKVHEDCCYFISIDRYYSDIYRLDLNNGEIENITTSKGSVQIFDISSKRISSIGFIDGRLQEIYSLEKSKLVRESNFNEDIFRSIIHPKIEYHVIKDYEGVDFDGFVMLPVDYDENKRYPAILNIHGGPVTTYGDIYFHEMKYWASENYFVLFCNPRGSDGKGNEFGDIKGKCGTIDYNNIMEFVHEMIEKYPALNSERIGVTGGSYGGFMTNWIIGHNDEFKAAVAQRSICNWISLFISDVGYYFVPYEIGSDIWGDYEKIWWHSPLKYANKIKTPTLILHSDEDYSCPVSEAYQMFTALRYNGIKSRLVLFRGENHELSRSGKPENRLQRLKEITDWMDAHL